MSSPPRIGMHSLADIELQLIFHCLDTVSRLRWARCSRRILSAAQDAFAWLHAPMLRVDESALSRLGTSLWKFAPTHLYLSEHADIASGFSLAAVPRLLKLEVKWAAEQCERELLAGLRSGAMAQVEDLTLPKDIQDSSLYLLLVGLTRMHTLWCRQNGEHLTVLSQCCALTQLSVGLRGIHDDQPWTLGDCRLRTLTLWPAVFASGTLQRLFTRAPIASTLQTLTLGMAHMDPGQNGGQRLAPPLSELQAAWRALTSLHTLQLRFVWQFDRYLESLRGHQQVRSLTLQTLGWGDGMGMFYRRGLSVEALRTLLNDNPQLQVSVSYTKQDGETFVREVRAAMAAGAQTAPGGCELLFGVLSLPRVGLKPPQ